MRHITTMKGRLALSACAVTLAAITAGALGVAGAASTPDQLGPTLSGVTRLVSGNEGYCALLHGGRVACRGNNSYGQLGAGSSASASDVPVTVRSTREGLLWAVVSSASGRRPDRA